MSITVDIDKELKEAIDARQVALDQANNLLAQRQAIVAKAMQPIEAQIKQLDAMRQNTLQEALQQSGAIRRLQSIKDRSEGTSSGKKSKKGKRTKKPWARPESLKKGH